MVSSRAIPKPKKELELILALRKPTALVLEVTSQLWCEIAISYVALFPRLVEHLVRLGSGRRVTNDQRPKDLQAEEVIGF